MSPTCEYPVHSAPGVAEPCDRPAKWETQDLQAVHHLCEEHCREALRWNDFRVDEVDA